MMNLKNKIYELYTNARRKFDIEKYCDTVIQIYLIYMAAGYGLYRFFPFLTQSGLSQYIAIAMAGLVFTTVLLRLRQLPLKYCTVFFFMLIAVLFSMLDAEKLYYIKLNILSDNTIKEVWVFPLAFMVGDNPSKRLGQMRIAAYLGVISYTSAMLLGFIAPASYMNFGYGIVLWWAVIAQSLFINKGAVSKTFDLILLAVSGAAIVMYANRAATLIIIAVIAVCLLLYSKPAVKYTAFGLGAATVLCIVFFFDKLLVAAQTICGYLGISSRNLELIAKGAFGDVSERFGIYANCLNLIKKTFPFGSGVCGECPVNLANGYYSATVNKGAYAHNILLELCVDYGAIVGLLLIAAIVIMGVRMLRKSTPHEWTALFMPIYVCSLMQLMFSSSVYILGSFWCAVMIYFSYQKFDAPRKDSPRKLIFA